MTTDRQPSETSQPDAAPPHLCCLGDGGQLQVLRVAPPEQLSVSGHGQAAVSVRADLPDLHPGQVPAHLHRSGAHIVMSETCKTKVRDEKSHCSTITNQLTGRSASGLLSKQNRTGRRALTRLSICPPSTRPHSSCLGEEEAVVLSTGHLGRGNPSLITSRVRTLEQRSLRPGSTERDLDLNSPGPPCSRSPPSCG